MLTRRRAVDRVRRLTAKKRGGGVYLVALDELGDCIPGDSAPAEDTDALREAIDIFLDSLSAEDRTIFIGRYFALESIESLAESSGTTKNTIHIRLSRMRKKLRTTPSLRPGRRWLYQHFHAGLLFYGQKLGHRQNVRIRRTPDLAGQGRRIRPVCDAFHRLCHYRPQRG